MIDLQTALTYLTLISVPVGVLYHIMTLRNTRKNHQLQLETRQAQLYSQTIQNFFDEAVMKKNIHLLKMEWDDYDDFERKYGSDINEDNYAERYSVWYFMNNLGFLLHDNLIPIRTVNAIVGQFALWHWDKFKEVIQAQREIYNMADFMEWFEYLANEIGKYRTGLGLSTEPPEGYGSYLPHVKE